jgi:hypothetical protein
MSTDILQWFEEMRAHNEAHPHPFKPADFINWYDGPKGDAALDLLDLMEGISEDNYCAGWLGGLEFMLWGIRERGEAVRFGQGDVNLAEIAKLRELSESCGGWWVPAEDHPGRAFLKRGGGEACLGEWYGLLPIEEWRKVYEAGDSQNQIRKRWFEHDKRMATPKEGTGTP